MTEIKNFAQSHKILFQEMTLNFKDERLKSGTEFDIINQD